MCEKYCGKTDSTRPRASTVRLHGTSDVVPRTDLDDTTVGYQRNAQSEHTDT